MTPVFLSVFLYCSIQEGLMNESQAFHFCWPQDVYDAMPISSIVVYVLLVTQNILPIYIMTWFTFSRYLLMQHSLSINFSCTRIKSKTTKKVVWFQSLLPSLLITTSSIGIIFPSLGIFVETVLEALLLLYLISFFEIADKWLKSKSEDPWHPAFYFIQVCFFFIMLWLKQIMFFMDIIKDEGSDSFWNFSYRTIVKLLDLSMNFPALAIGLLKIRMLHQANSLPNIAICIIIWYALFQSIWVFLMFLQGEITKY